MDVRNRGRCHGDATLQYSFAARLPMLAAASKPGEANGGGRGGKAKTRGQTRVEAVCDGIHRNANHLSMVCPSLCGGHCPGKQDVLLVCVNTTYVHMRKNMSMHEWPHTFHTHNVGH